MQPGLGALEISWVTSFEHATDSDIECRSESGRVLCSSQTGKGGKEGQQGKRAEAEGPFVSSADRSTNRSRRRRRRSKWVEVKKRRRKRVASRSVAIALGGGNIGRRDQTSHGVGRQCAGEYT